MGILPGQQPSQAPLIAQQNNTLLSVLFQIFNLSCNDCRVVSSKMSWVWIPDQLFGCFLHFTPREYAVLLP